MKKIKTRISYLVFLAAVPFYSIAMLIEGDFYEAKICWVQWLEGFLKGEW